MRLEHIHDGNIFKIVLYTSETCLHDYGGLDAVYVKHLQDIEARNFQNVNIRS